MDSQQAVTGGGAVVVEVLAFRVTGEDGLAFRTLARELEGGRHPDALARDLLDLHRDTVAHLLHSTSWRHEPDGRIVLTYACCPDPRPDLSAVPLHDRALARGAGPASPSPDEVQVAHVAAHAVRHLAFLWHTDATARQVIESVSGLAEVLAAWSPVPAGQLPAPERSGQVVFASR
ncbi:hypothetical protein [Actinomadura nitritigenes]|uniref:hypothetical protein n=1 Tax=Actinomadura nitritigenes TaxID=134602 RepID=UPI003D912833